ncbi:MAG TPA: VOC family protein [Bacteroidetes bacterium]|nr:VOC family protein [Bacteroidota bacterium]
MIKLNFLDHVAIRASDMEISAQWYEKTLGMKRYQFKEWGPFPLFLLSGKFGVAIFPADNSLPAIGKKYKGVKIDHFAFNVDSENFAKAKLHYEKLGLEYYIEDHVFTHSIYTKDPDGHTVELTTLVVEEKDFYK